METTKLSRQDWLEDEMEENYHKWDRNITDEQQHPSISNDGTLFHHCPTSKKLCVPCVYVYQGSNWKLERIEPINYAVRT